MKECQLWEVLRSRRSWDLVPSRTQVILQRFSVNSFIKSWALPE